MNVIHIHDKCSQHAVFLPFTLDANRNLATVNAYDNQQSIQRILSHPFAANCSESTTRNNTYLFDTNTNLHQSKTKPRSSMSTLFAKFQPVQTPFTFDIDASIIDIIIVICVFILMIMMARLARTRSDYSNSKQHELLKCLI